MLAYSGFTILWTLLVLCGVTRAERLVSFQVAQPPITPSEVKTCTINILHREFANSYGSPEIVQLTYATYFTLSFPNDTRGFRPPEDCGPIGSWSSIILNFTATSNGTQYDRLGIFTFQNVEIWRTSTPEPIPGDGIIWTYLKDVTQYMPLFTKPGTFILELDNLLSPGRFGNYTATVQATYYGWSAKHPPARRANTIIPLSTLRNDTGNDASVPPGFSTNVTIPQNAVELYAELFASGNSLEESWYFNVPNQFLSNIPPDITNGQGPFREVRLLIDGRVAGVAFPYAVIFTGGFIPSFWRPIAAYGALDLPTYYIDLTPFVPILTDGNPHTFTIDVASAEADHAILQNWYVSGILQVITDSSTKRTGGKITAYSASPFAQSSISGYVGQDGEVDFTVTANRKIHIEAEVVSGSGKTSHVVWSQDLSYSNHQNYQANGTIQKMQQFASGRISSTYNGFPSVADVFSYPLNIDFKYLSADLRNWTTTIDHSYIRAANPNPFMLTTTISERQMTDGFYQLGANATGNSGRGASNNTFSYADSAGNTYSRKVCAIQTTITCDKEEGNLVSSG